MEILSFGEIIFDIVNGNACLGGAPLNFCAHAVRAGANATLLSSVGVDELGKAAVTSVAKYGVNTDYIGFTDDRETGKCVVELDQNGQPCYNILDDVAYDYINIPDSFNKKYDLLYFGTLALRNAYNRQSLSRLLDMNVAEDIFVDVNIRAPFFSDETILFSVKNATVLKISDEELSVVSLAVTGCADGGIDKLVQVIKEKYKNVKILLYTCGESGATAYDMKNGDIYRCDAVKTKVVSTVGAGDSFSATFIVGYKGEKTITQSLKEAAEVSAYVVAHEGAIPE